MGLDEEKKRLIRGRGTCRGQLSNFHKYIEGIQGKTSLSDVELCELSERLKKLEITYDKFEHLQGEIELINDDVEVELEERSGFENSYFMLKSQATALEKKFSTPTDNSSSSSDSESRRTTRGRLEGVKLPLITLPTFSGDYKTWLEFRDIFGSMIHRNEALNAIQRFHYLRTSLEGTAAQIISSLDITADNYNIAWSTLCDRYDNKRLLVHLHLKSLFDLEVVEKESAEKIRILIDNVSKSLNALAALKQETQHWGTIIMYLVSTKLDPVTDREWEEFKGTKDDILSWDDMKGFLKSRADLLETLERRKGAEIQDKVDSWKPRGNKHNSGSKGLVANEVKCCVCKGNHFISNCTEFLKLSLNDRVERAKRLKLCLNCLRGGHFCRFCRSSPCVKCKIKHNVLLHSDVAKPPENSENQGNKQNQQVALVSDSNVHVFLSTVLLEIQDKNGTWHVCRALLDSGSQSNFLSLELCERLSLNKENIKMVVGGLGQSSSSVKYRCNVSVQALHNGFGADLNCLVLSEITGYIPNMKIEVANLEIPKNIVLADPSFYKPGKIDLLIGNELFYKLLCIGQINLGANRPILQKTRFGWVISGPMENSYFNQNITCNFSVNDTEFDLRKFWEIEHEFSNEARVWSNEESACEAHFRETFRRNEEGRFIVSLPLKGFIETLGESKDRARRRFFSLERKFQSDLKFKDSYVEFMKEYRELGHMTEVLPPDVNQLAYYMPHHGVMKESSLTTKLRVVFDCSMPTSTGISLNDLQMVGPVVQPDLISILMRFREHKFVISADIAKMYRQILVMPHERCLQRILWRESSDIPLKEFDLNTVTYGQASASFLAVRCIQQLADDCEAEFPDIAKLIRTSFYIDDFLCSVDSIERGIQICKNVSAALKGGCFPLRKWMSNEQAILSDVSRENEEFGVVEFGENENAKTLGLMWSCASDYLTYKIKNFNIDDKVTKRKVLSNIAQVFDPLGMLSPCVIVVKMLIQKLWLEKLTWDEALPSELHNVWLRFRSELSCINELKVPRHVTCVDVVSIELHGFSDASNGAYGGAIYLRSVDKNEKVTVRLLCAKGKVSPVKPLTTPRLEICGALVLARLVDKVLNSLNIKIERCILWTDSTIVLGWLKTAPNMLKTFVSSRVSEIQDLTEKCEWRHVSTKNNPADVLSRGVFPKQILSLDFWWEGPSFLRESEESWPMSIVKLENLPEVRSHKKVFSLVSTEFDSFLFDKLSSFSKLVRVIAWAWRFCQNCRFKIKKEKCLRGSLSTRELRESEILLIKLSQQVSFPEEYRCLESGKQLKAKSSLLSLNPFLDKEGVLRVGGRLRKSNFNLDKKHPMLISSKHRLTKLICEYEHKRLLHAGPQLLLSSIRSKYWPVSGRNIVKATVRNCLRCCRFNPQSIQPIMGDLPSSRLNPGGVFEVVGVDYMGPLNIKSKRGRGAKMTKCYVSVFVCFLTKALHLEVVSDLTTEAFVLTFRRFVARRGKPSHVYSDNGLNFVGANRELRELGNFLGQNENKLNDLYAQQGVQWHFIPAQSPHFGGLWEAGVKSAKHHLKRVAGNAHFTFEELTTLITQIESVLNSRPLSPLSPDPNDHSPLTPAHFLIGRSLTELPDPDIRHIPQSRLSAYQKIQQVKQNFWARWSKEYVSELQQRAKWKQTQSELQSGSLVLIKDDNVPALNWRLGRVVRVFPGADKVNRVAEIKTSTGILKRSFSKICPLPTGEASD